MICACLIISQAEANMALHHFMHGPAKNEDSALSYLRQNDLLENAEEVRSRNLLMGWHIGTKSERTYTTCYRAETCLTWQLHSFI